VGLKLPLWIVLRGFLRTLSLLTVTAVVYVKEQIQKEIVMECASEHLLAVHAFLAKPFTWLLEAPEMGPALLMPLATFKLELMLLVAMVIKLL